MTYLSDNIKKRKRIKEYQYFLFFFVVAIAVFFFFRKPLHAYLEPVILFVSSAKKSIEIFPEYVKTFTTSKRSLLLNQKELTITIENLENSLAEKDFLLKELQASEEERELPKKAPLTLYPLLTDRSSLYTTVVLSKGFKEGVEVDDSIYLRGRNIVCIIKEVSFKSSICQLISSSGVTTEAVLSSSSTQLSLSLEGKGGYFLGTVPKGISVLVGQTIYLKSDPSFTVGTVTKVLNHKQDTSLYVYVRGVYNPTTSSIFYAHKK